MSFNNRVEINCNDLKLEDLQEYPDELIQFFKENNLKLPKVTSGNGLALCAMVKNPNKYFTRHSCDKFAKLMNLPNTDSIQLFNKQEQRGIKQSDEKGKYYIKYPYQLSNKSAMRKDFKFDGSEKEKNEEINKIKSHITNNYIDIQNSEWQLGHKNPDLTDNTNNNLVLQPPIQAKYRDNYIFIDTLTKMPTPKKLKNMLKKKEIEFSSNQINDYIKLLQSSL